MPEKYEREIEEILAKPLCPCPKLHAQSKSPRLRWSDKCDDYGLGLFA